MDCVAAVRAMRSMFAFLIAPFPAALFQSLIVAVWPKPGTGVFAHPLSMFAVMCMIFYAFELIFGVPLYIATRTRLPRQLLPYAVAGMLVALIPVVILVAITVARGSLTSYEVMYSLGLFAVGGFFGGAVFWCIVSPSRQGQDIREVFD